MILLYFINQITNSGGIERIVIDKINYLANQKNYKVYLVFYGTNEDRPFYQIDEKVQLIPISVDVKGSSFIKKLSNVRKLISVVKHNIGHVKPDVIVNANVWVISYFLPFICRKIPKIVELHFSYDGLQIMNKEIYHSNKLKIAVNEALRRFIYPCYNKCVVLTNDDVKKWKFKNLEVIPNFSNIHVPKSATITREKIAITVGRLEFQKNHEALVNAWKPIAEKYPDWKLEIWGNGVLKETLQKQICDLNLQDKVCLKGVSSEIVKQYMRASFFVLSSRYEGQPLVMIEAMQIGLPCVSVSITGTNDIIEDGKNGYVVPASNTEAMSVGIEKMILSMDHFDDFSRKSIETSSRFKKETVMSAWTILFDKLTKMSCT